jgi:methylenetetrahydrofolate reductase (NADPH)
MTIPISFEVYPPRDQLGAQSLYEAIDNLGQLNPRFISVTFGAGGSNTSGSLEVLKYIRHNTSSMPLAHLTCVGTTSEQASEIVREFLAAQINSFLALRGDLPQGVTELPEHSLATADQLVSTIRDLGEKVDQIAVAAFPNGHPESGSQRQDILALKAKQDAGADFAITQLFFYASDYVEFLELARSAGITIPIIPGIMPITSAKRLARVLELTQEREPKELAEALALAADASSRKEVGIDFAAKLVSELVQLGAPGIHLYAFNEHKNVTEVLRRAGLVS